MGEKRTSLFCLLTRKRREKKEKGKEGRGRDGKERRWRHTSSRVREAGERDLEEDVEDKEKTRMRLDEMNSYSH